MKLNHSNGVFFIYFPFVIFLQSFLYCVIFKRMLALKFQKYGIEEKQVWITIVPFFVSR